MAADAMNRIVTALGALLLLVSCSEAPGGPPPLEGAAIGGPFALTDQNGNTVRETDFAGKYRIVYFGYTFCPDVCPIDVQNIAAGLRKFEAKDPARGANIVPIFVTVDPDRDTPAKLKEFVSAFHPRMVGLTGSLEAIAAAAKAFAVYYKKQPPAAGATGYLVDHARAAYLMSPQGKPIALLPADETADAVAAELERWVR